MAYSYYQDSGPNWGTSNVCQFLFFRFYLTLIITQFQIGRPPTPAFEPEPECTIGHESYYKTVIDIHCFLLLSLSSSFTTANYFFLHKLQHKPVYVLGLNNSYIPWVSQQNHFSTSSYISLLQFHFIILSFITSVYRS